MKKLEEIYKRPYHKMHRSLNWRAIPVCKSIIEYLNPESIIDVGCSCGDLVKGFQELGKVCYGLEGAKTAIPYLMFDEKWLFVEDLRLPISINHFFDLVICFEVAEHIEPEYADQFINNLVKLSKRILMSAAPPGQDGHYHVNCRPYDYWIYKFSLKGYIYNPLICNNIKSKWDTWKRKKGIKAYYDNLMFFERRSHAGRRNYDSHEKTRSSI